MMCAMKSLCEALEHIRGVQSGPEYEMCKEYYYFWSTRGAHRVDLGPTNARTRTMYAPGNLRCPKGKLRFARIGEKIGKEMA